jgi:hypothetical protein
MVCKDGSKGVIGAPFASLLDRESTPERLSLMDCMVSSSMGSDAKLSILKGNLDKTQDQNNNDPIDCSMFVSPIVARKTESREVTSVTHFAIELHRSDFYDDQSVGSAPRSPIIAPVDTDNMPMEVMG